MQTLDLACFLQSYSAFAPRVFSRHVPVCHESYLQPHLGFVQSRRSTARHFASNHKFFAQMVWPLFVKLSQKGLSRLFEKLVVSICQHTMFERQHLGSATCRGNAHHLRARFLHISYRFNELDFTSVRMKLGDQITGCVLVNPFPAGGREIFSIAGYTSGVRGIKDTRARVHECYGCGLVFEERWRAT